MIRFNVPPFMGKEVEYIKEAVLEQKICGDGMFTKKCSKYFEDILNVKKLLLDGGI